jgi:hypothetical protein
MSFVRSFSVLFLVAATPAEATQLPTRVGQCVATTVKQVETRLADGVTGKPMPGSGSAVSFANGGYQVSYDTVPAVERAKAGDPIRLCLVSVPKNCPRGDDRGKVYRAFDRRTRESWSLPDSEHECGGA